MSENDGFSGLGSAQLAIVDAVADRFEAVWRRDKAPPSMQPFLLDAPQGPMRRALFEKMLVVDERCRRELGLPQLSEDRCREVAVVSLDTDTIPMDWQNQTPRSSNTNELGSLERIGKYPTLRSLGQGGQATVFEAFHPDLGKKVVIKISRRVVEPNSSDHERLLDEGRMLAKLDHPGLVRVYDFDVEHGHPFLVMEHVGGLSLKDFVAQHQLSPTEGARIMASVARAIGAMHRRGIVHRDIKPENILIDEQGTPRVIDLGLASIRSAWTETAEGPQGVSGTVPYMAPEQARGETDKINARTDIFGLGAVLYWILTGGAPFWIPASAGMDSRQRLTQLLKLAEQCEFDKAALSKPGLPRRLSTICLKAMAADPAERYSTAELLADDLERAVQPRRGIAKAAGGCLVVLGLLAIGWWMWGSQPRVDSTPATGRLTMRVMRDEEWHDAVKQHLMPIQAGDQIRLHFAPPRPMKLAFFWLKGHGPTKSFPEAETPAGNSEIVYPNHRDVLEVRPSPDETPIDTELILVCGTSKSGISGDEIGRLWESAGPWPVLPSESVLRLRPNSVEVESQSRDVEIMPGSVDPELDVQHRLEKFRQELAGRVDYFEGIAFRRGVD